MEYVHLGRSGLSVSRLCLGTMNFGPLTPPAEAHAIMDHAHELGINFFDTANRYGGAQGPSGLPVVYVDDLTDPRYFLENQRSSL